MYSKNSVIIALLFGSLSFANAFFDPCQGKGSIGSSCDYDSDCTGFATVCTLGVCSCHPFYKLKNDSDGSKYCVKSKWRICWSFVIAPAQHRLQLLAADTIGSACTDTCRFPMFCNNGQCQCIRAKADGKRCSVNSNLGDTCTKNYECTLPFSSCINGRCGCIAGTSQSGGACVAGKDESDGA